MSTSEGEAVVVKRDGNRCRVREHTVQPGQTSCGSSDESLREGDETDWESAFKHLSAILGKQFLSGDCLYLVAMALRHHLGDEPAHVFAEHVGLNRIKAVHDFMG